MADVYSAAFYGEAAKLQGLIDRGGDVNYKTVRRRLAARPRPPRRRARALFGRRNRLLQPAVPAARPASSASRSRRPPLPPARYLPGSSCC